jgi:large subunit ribosomal protein L22
MLVKSTARLKYVSIPPRKMRLVANMVKGLPVEKALNILNFTPRIAAHHIAKTLKAAAANALSIEGTDTLKPEDLTVKKITVDEAPTAKRIRFQSMGRVFRYRKRFCHLTIELEGNADSKEAARPAKGRAKKADKGEKAEASAKTAKKSATKTKKTPAKKTAKAPAKKTAKAPAKKTAVKKTATKKAADKKTTAKTTKKVSKDKE